MPVGIALAITGLVAGLCLVISFGILACLDTSEDVARFVETASISVDAKPIVPSSAPVVSPRAMFSVQPQAIFVSNAAITGLPVPSAAWTTRVVCASSLSVLINESDFVPPVERLSLGIAPARSMILDANACVTFLYTGGAGIGDRWMRMVDVPSVDNR